MDRKVVKKEWKGISMKEVEKRSIGKVVIVEKIRNMRIYGMGFVLLLGILFLGNGCQVIPEESPKVRDLEFVVEGEEVIPEHLKNIIEEKKEDPFQLTYSDGENLYIVIGYGKKDSTGYLVTVNDLYLTQEAIHVDTQLLGPKEEEEKKTPSYPYIVLKTEFLDLPVVYH